MDNAITRRGRLLGAAALLCLLVVPIAVANGSGGPDASASASLKKQVKKLKKQVKQLTQQVDQVSKQPGPQGAQGETGAQGARGPEGPPGAATGPAGGDLTGSYPDPSIAGGAVDSAKVQNGSLGAEELSSSIPAARVTNGGGEFVPDGAFTVLDFDQEHYDTAGMHDNGSQSSRLTAPVSGVYQLSASIEWDAPQATEQLILVKNGVGGSSGTWLGENTGVFPNIDAGQVIGAVARLNAGDYVEVIVRQVNGGAITASIRPDAGSMAESLGATGDYTPAFSMSWIAPGP